MDTSLSIVDTRIDALNKTIRKIFVDVSHKYRDKVGIDILQYNTAASWFSKLSLPLQASEMTNYSEDEKNLLGYDYRFPKLFQCAVIFVTDGFSTDPYQDTFFQFWKGTWYSEALKVGIMLNENGNFKDIAAIVASANVVVRVSEQHISRLIEAAAKSMLSLWKFVRIKYLRFSEEISTTVLKVNA